MIHCARKVAESLEDALELLEASHEHTHKKARFHWTSLLEHKYLAGSTYI